MLFKNRGYSALAILTLALGIGINSSIFSVINALLLNPLPFKDSDRLVLFWTRSPGLNTPQDWLSPAQYADLKREGDGFEDFSIFIGGSFNLSTGERPERVEGIRASSSLFTLLGVNPERGRVLLPEEDQPGKPRVAVISHELWQRRFGGDPGVVGSAIKINDAETTIVGVLPADVSLRREMMPTVGGMERADVILPLPLSAEVLSNRGSENFNVMARLRPGVSLALAQTQADAIAERMKQEHPDNYPMHGGLSLSVVPVFEQVVGEVRQALLVLSVAVLFVLLIACANVANLLLARATAREREFALRTALGAGRGRIIRQLLTESMLLSVVGGGLGLLLAMWSLDWLRALSPGNIPRIGEIGIDGRVLAFTACVSLATGTIFGLAPAWKASKVSLNEMLKEGAGGVTGGGRGRKLRSILVASEIALSLVLLVGAGLLIRSFIKLREVDPGFSADNILSMRVSLAGPRYSKPEQGTAFFQQLLDGVSQLPGVNLAGGSNVLPLSPGVSWGTIWVEGLDPAATPIQADQRIAARDYFAAMGIGLVEGRFFDERDVQDSLKVAIVDEGFAVRFWPGQSALGKRVKRGGADSDDPWMTVIGVVKTVKQYSLDADAPRVAMYMPFSQEPAGSLYIVARTASDPSQMIAPFVAQVKAIDPEIPVYSLSPMRERLAGSLAQKRFSMLLLGLFAGVALLLAAVGIYGVMAYMVAQRTREIGIRMALGAASGNVVSLVIKQGMTVAALGVAAGVAGALALTQFMSSLLYGVSATDPLILVLVCVSLAAVSLLACAVPARRATRVDPIVALRYE
jgi:predicted permease